LAASFSLKTIIFLIIFFIIYSISPALLVGLDNI
jgi:hypothetical protein